MIRTLDCPSKKLASLPQLSGGIVKPFTLRYAQPRSAAAEEGVRGIEYCTQSETNILTEDRSLAIEHKDIAVRSTGTLITRAQTDPTNDESTDR